MDYFQVYRVERGLIYDAFVYLCGKKALQHWWWCDWSRRCDYCLSDYHCYDAHPPSPVTRNTIHRLRLTCKAWNDLVLSEVCTVAFDIDSENYFSSLRRLRPSPHCPSSSLSLPSRHPKLQLLVVRLIDLEPLLHNSLSLFLSGDEEQAVEALEALEDESSFTAAHLNYTPKVMFQFENYSFRKKAEATKITAGVHYFSHLAGLFENLMEIDFTNMASMTDHDVRALLMQISDVRGNTTHSTQLMQLQTIRFVNCVSLTRPLSYWLVEHNPCPFERLSLFLDGCWRLDHPLRPSHRLPEYARLWIDILDVKLPLRKEMEVVIISPRYAVLRAGCWVSCYITAVQYTNVGNPSILSDEIDEENDVNRYHIFVEETTQYANAVGFSSKPAFWIARKHLRHRCMKD